MSVASPQPAQFLYLFSSVPPNRPNYKMGVLNALCYPNGHYMELSYKKRDISPKVFENRALWKDQSGYFVFIDYKQSAEDINQSLAGRKERSKDEDHFFIPIRKVKVKKIYPAEEAKQYADTTRVYVQVELENLILFDEEWNKRIKDIPNRPKIGSPHYYLLGGDDFSPDASERSQRDIWDDLVVHAAKSKSLSDCVFLSTDPIKEFESRKVCPFTPYRNRKDADKAYQLRPSSIYELRLRVFNPKQSGEINQEISARSSSDLLVISQPFATTIGGPSDHSVFISCKRTIESILATLEISLKQRNDGVTMPVGNVFAAKPLYRISLSVTENLLWGFIGLVFFGVLFSGISKDVLADLCVPEPNFWASVAKFIGAGCLAGAAWLTFRKLPSGS